MRSQTIQPILKSSQPSSVKYQYNLEHNPKEQKTKLIIISSTLYFDEY